MKPTLMILILLLTASTVGAERQKIYVSNCPLSLQNSQFPCNALCIDMYFCTNDTPCIKSCRRVECDDDLNCLCVDPCPDLWKEQNAKTNSDE
jgi:hypothetical protein